MWGAPKGQLTTCTIFPETRLISKARIVFSRIRKSVFLKITGRGILLGGPWVLKKKKIRGGVVRRKREREEKGGKKQLK